MEKELVEIDTSVTKKDEKYLRKANLRIPLILNQIYFYKEIFYAWYKYNHISKVHINFLGTSGSGKSHASMLLLRQLFAVAGGGPETDAFKHLAAAFTVLRSLGSAKTITNSESSRIVSQIIIFTTETEK